MLTLTDPKSKVPIKYYGSEQPTLELAQELLSNAIMKSSNDLYTGAYKKNALGEDIDIEEQRLNLEKNAALQLRVPYQNVNSLGLGAFERAELGLRPTKGQKLEFLRQRYGYNNVQAMPVNGDYRLLVKSGEGDQAKYTFVNQEGLDFGDVAEFGAGVAIPIIVAGAVVSKAPALVAPLATPGWGSSVGLASISAGTYFGTAAAQDAIVAAVDQDFSDYREALAKRGKESAFALVPEAAFIRGGQWLSKFGGGSGVDRVARELNSSIEDLNAQFNTSLRAGAGGSTSASGAAREFAASENSAAIRKLRQENIDQLGQIQKTLITGKAEPVEQVIGNAKEALTQTLTKLSRDVARFDKDLATAVEGILQTRLKRLGGSKELMLRAPDGEAVQGGLQGLFNRVQATKRKLFDDATDVADGEAIVYNADNVIKAMRRAIEKAGTGFDDPAAESAAKTFASSAEKAGLSDEAVLSAIRDDLPVEFVVKKDPSGKILDLDGIKAISYRQLDRMIKRYAERADFGDISAVGSSAAFARLMRKELTKVRDKSIKGTETEKALNTANRYYRNDYGKFLRSDVKPLIKPDFGGGYGSIPGESYTVLGGEAVINRILSNSKSVREVIDTFPARASGDGVSRDQVIDILKRQYMNKIGLNGTVKLGQGFGLKGINNDIMSALYGRTWSSKVEAFKRLDDLASQSGKVIELDDNVFREILSAGTPSQVANAERIAADRIRAASQLTALQQDKLVKYITTTTGGQIGAADALEAIGSLLNYNTSQLKALKKVISASSGESGLNSLKKRLHDDLIEKARPNKASYPATSGGDPLFDPDLMIANLKEGTKTRKVASEILGDDYVKKMIQISNVAKYSLYKQKGSPGIRTVGSPGGGGFSFTVLASDLPKAVTRWSYGKISSNPMLSKFLSQKTPDQASMVFAESLPAYMFTAGGLKSLLNDMRYDPELTAYIQKELANLGNMSMMSEQQIQQAVQQETTTPRNPSTPR